ncbi:MAG: ABC transporter permease [Verrucomicrobiota bacterium]|nr:ABC transporter permease [Verrucomicrobiota bacterium]
MSEINAQNSSSLWKDAWLRLSRNRMAVIGGAILLALGLLSLCASWISPYKYETQNLELGAVGPQLAWDTQQLVYGTCTQQRAQVLAEGYEGEIGLLPVDSTELHRAIEDRDHGSTLWVASPTGNTNLVAMVITSEGFDSLEEIPERANFILLKSRGHLLGTDELGRDLFTRILYGGRISLMVGLCATAVSLTIGVLFGAVAGFFGGRVDDLMMRFVDILYALPFTIFVILLTVIFDRNIWNLFLAIGAVEWLTMSRIVRGQVLSLRKQEFVEAAIALGIPQWRIVLRHIIPNCLGPVIVYTTLTIPVVMLLEAFLSFLGLGVQPPMSSWGLLIRDGSKVLEEFPWLMLFPGMILALTLFSLNFLGDGLRDALDVRVSKD